MNNIVAEKVNSFQIALKDNGNTIRPVIYFSEQTMFRSQSVNKRPESDTLNQPLDQYFISLYNSSRFLIPLPLICL
jgi:hypothetical protein